MPYLNPHPDDDTVYCCTACESANLWDRTDAYVRCHDCDHLMTDPDERAPRGDPPTTGADDLPVGTDPAIRAKIERLRAAREGSS